MEYPLREKRKKQNRRDLLISAASLFSEKGYEETTLKEVAEKAGLHVQTLYRHFPTKADFIAEFWHQNLLRFEAFFADRKCDSLSAWRNYIEQITMELTQEGSVKYQKRMTSFWEIPFVSTETLRFWYRFQEVLAVGIAQDMGVEPTDNGLPMLIACMLWGGNGSAARHWAETGGKDDLAKTQLAVVDIVIDQFQHLLTFNS